MVAGERPSRRAQGYAEARIHECCAGQKTAPLAPASTAACSVGIDPAEGSAGTKPAASSALGGDVTSSSWDPLCGDVTTVQGAPPLEPSEAVEVSTSECSSLLCTRAIGPSAGLPGPCLLAGRLLLECHLPKRARLAVHGFSSRRALAFALPGDGLSAMPSCLSGLRAGVGSAARGGGGL